LIYDDWAQWKYFRNSHCAKYKFIDAQYDDNVDSGLSLRDSSFRAPWWRLGPPGRNEASLPPRISP
jgi:hypothetical protein